MRSLFGQASRSRFVDGLGLSVARLTRAMIEALSTMPVDATPSKEVVMLHLGVLGQLSKSRDINAAWTAAKRSVAKEYPARFCLDGKVLRSTSTTKDRPVEKLSVAAHRRLAALAAKEVMTPDELVDRMIAAWRGVTR